MKSYVVALQLPTGDATELAAAGERARGAAEQLTREGTAVRWVRSVYLPEDDACLLVFEAPTPEAVEVAGRRAGLTYDRIVEGGRATELRPEASPITQHDPTHPTERWSAGTLRGPAERRPR